MPDITPVPDPNAVGRDPIKDAMQGALRTLDGLLNERGWDQPAALWAISRDMNVPDLHAMQFQFSAVNTGPILTDRHPSDGLAMIARAVASGKFRPPPIPNVFGFAFVSEAWIVTGTGDDGAIDEDLERAARDRQLHTRADRVEARVISAVDVAGIRYCHVAPRDETKLDRLETAARPSEAGDGPFMDGYIFDSLATLVEAVA